MDTSTWTSQRGAGAARRKPPRPQRWIRFAADSDGDLGPPDAPKPTEVFVEATHPNGEAAQWLDDWWWMECLSRWKDDALTIHILPSPAALLHPVVRHHVEMIRRVAPSWRVVGHVYLEDLDLDDSPDTLARSPYHEVRVIDRPMPHPVPHNPKQPPKLDSLFGSIRRVQKRLRATLPALVRASQSPDEGYDWSAPPQSTGEGT